MFQSSFYLSTKILIFLHVLVDDDEDDGVADLETVVNQREVHHLAEYNHICLCVGLEVGFGDRRANTGILQYNLYRHRTDDSPIQPEDRVQRDDVAERESRERQ